MSVRSLRWSIGGNLAFGLLALLVLSARPATTAPPDTTPETIQIASWNIEWLGRSDRRFTKLAQKPGDIAQYLKQHRVDLVCFNEISATGRNTDEADAPLHNATLDQALALLNRDGGDWRHILFPKDDGELDQLVGVAWNRNKLRLVGEPRRMAVRRVPGSLGEDMFRRHPYAAKFSAGEGKTDFVVIPVHLKSNRGGDETIQIRGEEGKSLARGLGGVQLAMSDDDILILGDCNVKKATEPAVQRLVAAGLRDLNAADVPTWIKSDRFDAAPFDHIFVPDDQPEFKTSKFRVCRENHLGGEAEFRKILSDHYMIATEIKIGEDDD